MKRGKRKAGRPRIEFDLEVVEGLGRIGATAAEMAAVLPASQSTIEHRVANHESDFYKAYEKGRGLLKASLRRKQIAVAMAGNVTMLIWLGKQHLDQQDRSAHEHVGKDRGPIALTTIESEGDARKALRAEGVEI